ncbi:hypothetical protein ACRCUN_01300 [Mycobacterium sp. LTG2003]
MADDSDTATAPFTPSFDTGGLKTPVLEHQDELPSEPLPAPAPPMEVPSTYQYLGRWSFVLVVAGVWIVAGAAGLGLYHFWFGAVDKTWPVFLVFGYVVITTVAGLLAAMAQRKPLVSALAIALMSAPLASVAAAAVLYGAYVFGWIAR